MFNIIKKDIRLFFLDKRAVMLTFIMPIAVMSLIAFSYSGMGKGDAPKPIKLMVSDLDGSPFSKEIISNLISLKSLDVELIELDSAQNLIKKGEESSVLIFHKGLTDSVFLGHSVPIELQYDQAKAIEVGLLQQALLSKLMSSVGKNVMINKAMKEADEKYSGDPKMLTFIHEKIKEDFESNFSDKKNSSMNIQMTSIVAAKEDNDPGLIQAVAGTAVMMLLFSITAMGGSLLDEKEEGTLKRLLYSPIQTNFILFGKMISANIVSMLQLSILFLFAWNVFHLNVFLNLPALIVMLVATAFAASSFGMLLASIAKSRQQLQSMASLIILIMSALGGSMVPSFLMPEWMQKLSMVSINYWSIQGFYDIFWRHLAITDITFLTHVGMLFLIGIIGSSVAVILFRRNVLKIA